MKNPNKVYTGKVGAKPRAKRIRASRATGKKGYFCIDGPMAGETLYLGIDGASMPMVYMGGCRSVYFWEVGAKHMTEQTKTTIQDQIRALIAQEVEKERLRCIAIAMQYGHPLIAEAMKHAE